LGHSKGTSCRTPLAKILDPPLQTPAANRHFLYLLAGSVAVINFLGGGGGGDDVNNILAYSPDLSSLPVSASAQPGVMSAPASAAGGGDADAAGCKTM